MSRAKSYAPLLLAAALSASISSGCGGAELSPSESPRVTSSATAGSTAKAESGPAAVERRRKLACDAGRSRAMPPVVALPVALEGRVVAIVVEGLDQQSKTRFRELIESKVGAPADPQTVAADVRRLWALGELEDISVQTQPRQGGVALRFLLRQLPAIGLVFFEPAQSPVKALWPSRSEPSGRARFDSVALKKVGIALTKTMVADGYRRFGLEVLTHRPKADVIDLCIHSDMGPRALIDRLEIDGNKSYTDKQLRSVWTSSEGQYNAVGKPYYKDALAVDMLRVVAFYYDRGYLSVRHDEPQATLSSDGTRLSLRIPIEEGPQYRIGKLSFKGPRPATYPPVIKSKAGQVFNRGQMMADLRAIEKLHADQGEQVSVVPLMQLFPAKQRVDVVLQVSNN